MQIQLRRFDTVESCDNTDVSRSFDYSDLKCNELTEMPADNATYRQRMKRAVVEIVEEIVARLPEDSVRR